LAAVFMTSSRSLLGGSAILEVECLSTVYVNHLPNSERLVDFFKVEFDSLYVNRPLLLGRDESACELLCESLGRFSGVMFRLTVE